MNGRRIGRYLGRAALLVCVVATSAAWDRHGKRSEAGTCGAVPIARPSGLCHGPVVLGPAIPADMTRNGGTLDAETGGRMVDCFAWESFAALNWPGSSHCRGAPAKGGQAATDWTSEPL